jgi:hypothetical protein
MIDIGFNIFDGSYMGITFLLSLSSIFITTLALVSMFPAIELERRKGALVKKLDDLCDCVFYTPADIEEYKRNREKILLILSAYQYNFEMYQQLQNKYQYILEYSKKIVQGFKILILTGALVFIVLVIVTLIYNTIQSELAIIRSGGLVLILIIGLYVCCKLFGKLCCFIFQPVNLIGRILESNETVSKIVEFPDVKSLFYPNRLVSDKFIDAAVTSWKLPKRLSARTFRNCAYFEKYKKEDSINFNHLLDEMEDNEYNSFLCYRLPNLSELEEELKIIIRYTDTNKNKQQDEFHIRKNEIEDSIEENGCKLMLWTRALVENIESITVNFTETKIIFHYHCLLKNSKNELTTSSFGWFVGTHYYSSKRQFLKPIN